MKSQRTNCSLSAATPDGSGSGLDWVSKWSQSLGRRCGECVTAQHVDVGIGQRGQPRDVLFRDFLPVFTQGREGGIGVFGVPEHDGVEYQPQRAELVFLALAVALVDLPAPAVEDRPCQPMT